MPEQLFNKIKQNIKPEWRFTFFSAVIIGLLTHLFVFTNRLPNHDSLHNIYNTQAKVKSGRFFLGPASGMSSYFELPWVIGLLSILFLALAAVSIVMLFRIQKKSSALLIAGIVTTFPSVAATFSYMFTADGYMLGIFFAILAVAITKRYIYGFIPGAILLSLSVGIYQAGLSITLAFIVIWLLREILFTKQTTKALLLYIVRFGAMVGIGMIVYLIVFKTYTRLLGGYITNYQGLNKVGSVTMNDIPTRLHQIVYNLKDFFFHSYFAYGTFNTFEKLNIIVWLLLISMSVWLFIKNRLYKQPIQLILFILLSLTLPIIYYIVYFISPDAFYHMLMLFSLSTVYIFLVVLYDQLASEKQFFLPDKIGSWLTVSVMTILIFNFAIIANITYFNMELRYEKTMALSNRILDRVEQLEQYKDIEKIMVSGRVSMYSKLSSETIPQKLPNMIGSTGENFLTESYHYKVMLESFLGFPVEAATLEEQENIQNTLDFQQMPVWPAKESVRVFNDTLVIKFKEK